MYVSGLAPESAEWYVTRSKSDCPESPGGGKMLMAAEDAVAGNADCSAPSRDGRWSKALKRGGKIWINQYRYTKEGHDSNYFPVIPVPVRCFCPIFTAKSGVGTPRGRPACESQEMNNQREILMGINMMGQ